MTLQGSDGHDEPKFRLLIDAIIDYAIYMIGLDGTVQSWNTGAERLKGYPASEILGRPFAQFFTPEDQDKGLPQRALAQASQDGRYEAEGWRLRKDGSRFWALAVLDAVRDDNGDLIGFVKITRDLTERHRAQQELVESEQRYRRLIEAVVDYAIFQLDSKGYVTSWNPGAERIKGYTASEIIGQHFSVFYTEQDRKAGVPARVLHTAEAGKFEGEGLRQRKDGSTFVASVVVDPIRDEDGKVIGFAKVTRDMTERVKAQEALQSAQEQLATSQKLEAIGQLSGGVAHDFNNLLMIILGNLEMADRKAQQGVLDAEGLQRVIGNARKGAQRAAALTSRLLAFSRRQPLDPQPIDINRFITGSVEFLQRSLGEAVEVEALATPGLWMVEADSNQLETVLVNIAINARDAMPNGGKLTMEASNVFLDAEYARLNPEVSEGQFVMISVSDTGEGMSRDALKKAVEPFFTTKDVGRGTGLGLSQVYGFLKQSGGHLKLYSEVGLGTIVKLYLPRAKGDVHTESPERAAPLRQYGRRETILLVEDDPDLRVYLTELLQDLNFVVHPASGADEALEYMGSGGTLDLLLTDVVMPGMNGRQLAENVRQALPEVPVLFMTGYSRNVLIREGRLDQRLDVIHKPLSQTELGERVRAALDRRRTTNRNA